MLVVLVGAVKCTESRCSVAELKCWYGTCVASVSAKTFFLRGTTGHYNVYRAQFTEVNATRSQAVTRIANRTASQQTVQLLAIVAK